MDPSTPQVKPCGMCGAVHVAGTCPALIRDLGAADRSNDLAPPTGQPDPMLGLDVGPWELISVLGVGSFGVVYRAVHRETHEVVALKLLHSHLAKDPEAVRRFVGEARATLMVQHENVVQVKAIDVLPDNRYYIVLELLEGETLEKRCERGPIPFEDAAPLLRQMCDALGAAHAVGIVHRDLKPENLYLALRDNRPMAKVLDFGVARRNYLASGERRTQTGLVLGTPQYLSPEQSMGLEVDQRSDVYSLGVIMYRMVTGQLPFEGGNAIEVILAHRNLKPKPPSAVLPGLPAVVDTVVLKALAKAPADRFPSMDKFEAALAAAVVALEALGLPKPSPTIDLLAALEAAPADGHYQLLGVREGADAGQIRSAAARLWQRFDVARATADGDLFVRLESAGRRVAAAEEVLLDPRARASFDADRGNFLGVARAITNGLDLNVLNAMRELYLLNHPELEVPRPYPEVPTAPGAPLEAVALELGRRLKEDPLNVELHRRYWPLRNSIRRRGSTGIGLAPKG